MPKRETAEPETAATSAGLIYVNDTRAGIRRVRAGKGFRYVRPGGSSVRDEKTLSRIRSLAIPPAYRDVWIALDPRAHLQATGRDARGRKQYRYHPRWREVRDQTKFDRMIEFSRALSVLRARVSRDLARPGLSKEKVLAAIVRLLESTCARIGNEEYARDNDSFGLTTLRDRHVKLDGKTIVLEFRGKQGKKHRCAIHDRAVARIVARCEAIPGQELFQYLDEDGKRHDIDSGDVNEYIRESAGKDFSAKDLRTWIGTLLAARALSAHPLDGDPRRSRLLAAIDETAKQLNNTRSVCRKFYIHPAVIEEFEAGGFDRSRSRRSTRRTLAAEERALVATLRAHARRKRSRSAASRS